MSSTFSSEFEPYHFGEKTEALLELQSEIRSKGAEIFSLYFDSIAGYEMLTKHLAEWKENRTADMKRVGFTIDDETWSGFDHFVVDPPPHGHGADFGEFARSLADYRERLLPSGRNALLVGNYLLIALYQHWEDSWRVRIAHALKLEDKNLISSDFWGDLRLIRICLIHKKGIADSDVATKSALFRWFKEGDLILIDKKKTEAIIGGFFRFLYTDLFEYKNKTG